MNAANGRRDGRGGGGGGDSRVDWAAYADAASAAIGLHITPGHRAGVAEYLALAASFAALLHSDRVQTVAEPAPVFTPLGPDDLPGDLPADPAAPSSS